MLYLAEVKKQNKVFGSEIKLKLLAYQRNDQSWVAQQSEELLPTEQASMFGDGSLVVVNLDGSRTIQGEPKLASSQIVADLQKFSRLLEKSREQEEEIETWKQSLTYQSNELNRREMEMETRIEQLEQMEEEFERLEQQRQEADTAKEETARLKEEIERNRAELEGAWEHLRGEQRRLEELQNQVQPTGSLDEEQVNRLRELVTYLESTTFPLAALQEQLNEVLAVINIEQSNLDQNWQQLEENKSSAQEQQQRVEKEGEQIAQRQQELLTWQSELGQAQKAWELEQNSLSLRRELLQSMRSQWQSQGELCDALANLANSSGGKFLTQKVDLEALENMPLGELESLVANLQQDLEMQMRFVKDQEEELTLENQDIEELKQKVDKASDYDRLSLDQELTEAQDRYQMLDRTLLGQRRTLRDREEVFYQHQRILRRRQGILTEGDTDTQSVDLSPVIYKLEQQQQDQEQELQRLENEIEQINNNLESQAQNLEQQKSQYESQQQELQSREADWQQAKLEATQLGIQVQLSEEMLSPWQERLNATRQKLEELTQLFDQCQQTAEYQSQAVSDLQQTVDALGAGN